MKKLKTLLVYAAIMLVMIACKSTRHVPQGSLLLESVHIDVENDSVEKEKITELDLLNYLRQQPNHKVLGFAKLQLGIYNMSGNDSTKWYNRWLRRIGQAPVIYDSLQTQASVRQLQLALVNKGYMHPQIYADTIVDPDGRKIKVNYNVRPGVRHTIGKITTQYPDTAIQSLLQQTDTESNLVPGSPFDRVALDEERARITTILRNNGYWEFSKEYVTFIADTAENQTDVFLTVAIQPPYATKNMGADSTAHGPSEHLHKVYKVRNVIFVTDYNALKGLDDIATQRDTVHYRNFTVLYGPDHYINAKTLADNCYITPGKAFNAKGLEHTYQALGRLGILRFINIEMKPVATLDDSTWLDAYVLLSRNKKQNVSVQVEGTNSEGDLGFGVGLTYQHRDIFHGSEMLTAKFRTAYESLSGNVDGLINNRYSEYAGEVGITFPKFKAPFLSRNFKRRINATTEFAISANYQERPEYTRVIAGAAWKYKWNRGTGNHFKTRHAFDLLDINYVYLPKSTINFIDEIAPTNPLLRYSYEDHFIMRMGYTYYRTNRRIPTTAINSFAIQPFVSTVRASGEVAGNLLYAFSKLTGQHRHDGAYKVFGIQYAQYVKGEVDYNFTRNFNSRNALAFHVGAGVAYPYGNSAMVPFEKRFYAGGANSVRGWGARTLGPGRYDARNSVTDFINQCGDIRLDFNIEYRAKLFWVFEGALFIDAGNIWTVKSYQSQPGGLFKFNSFYKELAAAYGIGLRMDFTYFLLRLDLGMKAHNPAMNQEQWPLIHPNWHRDSNFHFAVGYPF